MSARVIIINTVFHRHSPRSCSCSNFHFFLLTEYSVFSSLLQTHRATL